MDAIGKRSESGSSAEEEVVVACGLKGIVVEACGGVGGWVVMVDPTGL